MGMGFRVGVGSVHKIFGMSFMVVSMCLCVCTCVRVCIRNVGLLGICVDILLVRMSCFSASGLLVVVGFVVVGLLHSFHGSARTHVTPSPRR